MSPEDLLSRLLKRLDNSGLDYAVVNPGNSDFPDTSSDVDLVFSANPVTIIDEELKALSSREGLRVVQKLHYDVPCGYYYIIFLPGTGKSAYLHLDCLYDRFGLNRYHLPTTFLLLEREKTDWGYRCKPAREAEYLLVKRIIKNAWTGQRFAQLKTLFQHNDYDFEAIACKWLGRDGVGRLADFLGQDNPQPREDDGHKLRNTLESRYALRNPVKWVLRKLYTGVRINSRLVSPVACFIVLVGPDGAGKSTINEYIQADLKRAFRAIWHFHWRPNLLPKLRRQTSGVQTTVAASPPQKSRYTGFVSIARFLYYWLDFVVGYWLVIYPKRAASTLVIGERYFPDILVHPERYGFSVPIWFMRLSAKLVPSADLLILLKDEPEAIFRRKPELSIKKIRQQLSGYEAELGYWRSPHIVITSCGPDAAGKKVAELVINACHDRLYPGTRSDAGI